MSSEENNHEKSKKKGHMFGLIDNSIDHICLRDNMFGFVDFRVILLNMTNGC